MGDRRRFTFGSRARSFAHAFAGIAHLLRTQHNAWIHAAVNLAVILLALWLRRSALEWAVLVVAMMAVWVAELINTAVEAAVDLSTTERSRQAGLAKDVAAGAVLVAAGGAVLVGLLVLGPPLWTRLFG
jgi:diacylglycerol kinase